MSVRARHVLSALCVVLSFTGGALGQVWEVDQVLLEQGTPLADSGFGNALATGDFDFDSDQDLVVGAPTWSSSLGERWIYRGSGPGRTLALWDRFASNNEPVQVGAALAVGDFNGDGQDEIAEGEVDFPVTWNFQPVAEAGLVTISHFVSGCACFQAIQSISEIDTASFSVPVENDHFGAVLASGDFDFDGFDDLAVGVPDDDVDTNIDAGSVYVFYGSVSGLQIATFQGFRAGSEGVLGQASASDQMGLALATGDFDGDLKDDLAIGAPGRTVSAAAGAGQVHVLRGSDSGLTTTGQQLLDMASFGDMPATNDRLGQALASANFDEPGEAGCGVFTTCHADLAIGAPGRAIDLHPGAGAVIVGYGGDGGVKTTGATTLTQTGSGGGPENFDGFGSALAAGQLEPGVGILHTQFADLAVGAPGEDSASFPDDGEVDLFFGSAAGIGAERPPQVLGQKAGFKIAPSTSFEHWGQSLAISDIDGDGWGDLVAAAPQKKRGAQTGAGAVEVLFGALFADGFESATQANWSSTSP